MPSFLSDRRKLLSLLAVGGAALPVAAVASPGAKSSPRAAGGGRPVTAARAAGPVPDAAEDQTAALQKALDEATLRGEPLLLPAGRFLARGLRLRPGSAIVGVGDRTVLAASAEEPVLIGEGAHGVRLERIGIAGTAAGRGHGARPDGGLVELVHSRDVLIRELRVSQAPANGLVLRSCSGRVVESTIEGAALAALVSLDAAGLAIEGNRIADCDNNGILVWRTKPGEDGTRVAGNRIERIAARAGGSGQNGNGVNVFRASGVLVTGNRIVDCAYSAIRGNAASNLQMVANSVERIGEVALYAEFGFEGALIAQNLVDGAACGISVTNFNEGGRLAVVQGNLIRNLWRREHEPQDKRGEGICVEADATVSGNTIEGAPTAGIVVGWGRYMREVSVTSNVIRKARTGILVTRDAAAGAALIAQNLIAGTTQGAVRLMENGTPVGEDLARGAPRAGRITVTGNLVVDAGA
jgi:uncharacterized secreted repeat protein (TIGR03808 family)